MVLRVSLSKGVIAGLVVGKTLTLCFQAETMEVEGNSGSRRSFAEVVSGGTKLSEESFEFPVL